MSNNFANKYYIADQRWLVANSARAKEMAKNSLIISDSQSDAWKEWDEQGELLYAEALDEIERLQAVVAKVKEMIVEAKNEIQNYENV